MLKEKRRNGECWQNKETPHTVDKIESFSDQIRKAFDEFDISLGAASKVVKQDFINGNGQHLLQRGLGKRLVC